MTTDSSIRGQYLKLIRANFLLLSQFLRHVTLKLAVRRSRPSVPYGATFQLLTLDRFVFEIMSWEDERCVMCSTA